MMASKLRVGVTMFGMVLGSVVGCGSDEALVFDASHDGSPGMSGKGGNAGNSGISGSGGVAGNAGGMAGTAGTSGTAGASDAGGDADAMGGAAGTTDGSAGTRTDGAAGSSGRGAGGTSGASPGSVVCGSAPCAVPANNCCVTQGFPLPTQCMPMFPGCVTFGAQVSCDDNSDCGSAQTCCARPNALGGGIGSIQCASTCNGQNDVPVCANGGECTPPRTCQALTGAFASYKGCLPP